METIQGLIGHYGYFALYGILALGMLGLPVPDELVMTFTGYLISIGSMNFLIALAVSVLGSVSGMGISYLAGKKVGKPFLWKHGKWLWLTKSRIEKAESLFNRYGAWAINIGYFIPGFRHLASFMAGTAGMTKRKYLVFAASGAAIWCTTFLIIGRLAGAAF